MDERTGLDVVGARKEASRGSRLGRKCCENANALEVEHHGYCASWFVVEVEREREEDEESDRAGCALPPATSAPSSCQSCRHSPCLRRPPSLRPRPPHPPRRLPQPHAERVLVDRSFITLLSRAHIALWRAPRITDISCPAPGFQPHDEPTYRTQQLVHRSPPPLRCLRPRSPALPGLVSEQ